MLEFKTIVSQRIRVCRFDGQTRSGAARRTRAEGGLLCRLPHTRGSSERVRTTVPASAVPRLHRLSVALQAGVLRCATEAHGRSCYKILEEQNEAAGSKEKARRKKCDPKFSCARKDRVFQENYIRIGVRKLLRTGLVLGRTSQWHCAYREDEVGEAGDSSNKKESWSLSPSVNYLEVEEDLSTMTLFFCADEHYGGKNSRGREGSRSLTCRHGDR